jgi:hypothetical protein
MGYNPVNRRYALTRDTSVNYLLATAKRPMKCTFFTAHKAVLFDLDGTLVDSAPGLGLCG